LPIVPSADPRKAQLRSRLLAARSGLGTPGRADATARIHERLLTLPEVAEARVLIGYAAFGSEVSIDAVLGAALDRGAGVLLPWVEGDELGIARIRDLAADLAPGWRGVREPRASGRRPARPDRVEAALVPGVGFDRRGNRLGYGGGHFDRLLARLSPQTPVIGVAFDVQVLDSLPVERHDVPVDIVVTESVILRPEARRSEEPAGPPEAGPGGR
jgi:5-formyltetrahydrofolate cyclo-ligase